MCTSDTCDAGCDEVARFREGRRRHLAELGEEGADYEGAEEDRYDLQSAPQIPVSRWRDSKVCTGHVV